MDIHQNFQIDRARILGRLANDIDLLREMIQIYREDYPNLLQKIETAISDRNSGELEETAHAIKGLICNFLHDPTTAMAFQLEKRGRQHDWTDVDAELLELKVAAAQLLNALELSVA